MSARDARRRAAALLLTLAALVLAMPVTAPGQEQPEGEAPEMPPLIEELMRANADSEDTDFMPTPVHPAWLDEEGQQAQRNAFAAYYRYRSDGFDHRRRVFEWQLLSSRVIFVLVVSLVAAGVYFSWLQFRQGLSGKGGTAPETTFEATGTGIKVSSPVLGVIILTISLAFFYLYLVYVYPIEEIL